MAIIFGGDAGIRQNTFDGFVDKITSEFNRIKTGILENFSRLTGEAAGLPPPPPKEKVFIDDGFTNVPGTSFAGSQVEGVDDIKTRRITTQEPQMTVYIKKRMFWSLRNENDTRFMDPGEKLFIRASKILFENKCSQIAAYESLTKAGRLVTEDADLDADIINAIADNMENFFEEFSNALNQDALNLLLQGNAETAQEVQTQVDQIKGERAKLIDGLRRLTKDQRKLRQSTTTNWVVDPDNAADVLGVGRGSGVIELTSVTNLNTDLSLEHMQMGQVQFSFEDPYNLTKVTSDNIEIALSAAFKEQNALNTNGQDIAFLNLGGPQNILETAREKDLRLNRIRRNRINNAFGLGGSGTILSGSDAVEIVFEIQPSSFAKNKVNGSVATIPEPFTKDTFRIVLLQLPIEYQLTLEEDTLVTEIFDLLDQYVTEIQRLNSAILENNSKSEVKYARRQLRNHYLGKSIVQPMDGVHVFIRSNTFKDGEITGPLGALLNGTNFVQSFAQDRSVSDAMLEEEMKQFGLEELGIPVSVYRIMRTGSFMRNAGTHVFGGLVSTVTESYNADRGYVLNISGESNLKWLNMSRVNTAPALNQPNGILEDPLTPFDLNSAIDPGTGLLKEKPELLDANKVLIFDGKLRFVTGDNAGKPVESELDLDRDYFPFGDSVLPVGNHAPGLTYRWKEGVIAVTRNVNLRTALDGTGVKSKRLAQEVGVSVVPNSFSNLDAADVVSLLVTGYPHNYESFILNSRDTGTYIYGSQSNNPESYFHYFFDITRNSNRALGNFQPFKIINISQEQLAKRINLQIDLKSQSKKLTELRSELAKLQDQLNSINTPPEQLQSVLSTNDLDRRRVAVSGLAQAISSVKLQIDRLTSDFTGKLRDASTTGLRIYGNDISLTFETTTANSTQEEIRENDKRLRIRNELLQLRTQLRCKFNNDTNMFIVSDEYDKDLDIQAFVIESIASQEPSLWDNTQYKHPYDICINVAKTLDFEFFCDTQGNIQFRAPKYNKVPLSLILRLFLLDKNQNKKLYPVFLEQMFKDRLTSYKDEADIIEIEIQIQNILLGKPSIVSSEAANSITPTENPEEMIVVSDFIGIDRAPPSDSALKDRAGLLVQARNDLASKIGGTPSPTTDEQTLENAAKEIFDLNNPTSPNVNAKRLEITNKLAQLESRKQNVVSTIAKITSQVDKFATSIDGAPLKGQRLSPQQMTEILTPFADLVEDDFNDFLGPGSSKRFIIYDEQLINSSFTESDSQVFCRVDVNGQQDWLGEGPGILGGIPMIWAGATDFDLWRQYGWRAEGAYTKPFFKDAELQCAPYALMLLSRSKRDAVRGQVTIAGNEYYQLGDVVYVNSRDMLYYVTAIKHNFSYEGGSFTTTLELRYGHPLGEYIPTPLDAIGKNLIKNQRNFNTRTTTRQTAVNGTSLGIVIFPSVLQEGQTPSSESAFKEMLGGDVGQFNLAELKNAFLKAKNHIIDGQAFPKIDIRGFILSEADRNLVLARMEAVKKWLLEPSSAPGSRLDKKEFPGFGTGAILAFSNDGDPIKIQNMQESNAATGRIPREEVFNALSGRDFPNIIELVLVSQ